MPANGGLTRLRMVQRMYNDEFNCSPLMQDGW